jgi:hypothetical protein
MYYNKPDFNTSLTDLPSIREDTPVSEALRLSGAGFVNRGKVKVQAVTFPGTTRCQLTGSVQGSFGIMFHPALTLVRRGSEILVERHRCGCRDGARARFCAHCAALLVSHYGHADARILSGSPEEIPEEEANSGIRIRLGTQKKTSEPVYWTPEDARRLASANIAVVGGEDTGNSQMLQSVAIQILRQKAQSREPVGLLLFDGLDDYSDSRAFFADTTGARVLRMHNLPLNPFSLYGLERKPQLHVHTAMSFADALVRAHGLGALEKSTLVQSISAAYAARGITSDPLTWDLPAPTFEDVYAEYLARPQSQRSDSLAQAMENLSLLDLFDAEAPEDVTFYDLIRGTVILDMSGYPETLKRFLLRLLLEMLCAQMQGRERTLGRELQKLVLIDNADALLAGGCPGLEGLLRQGREFGLGLLLSVHSLDFFRESGFDCRKWISTWILHNVQALRKTDLEYLLQIDIHDSSLERLYQESRNLRKLHSLIRIHNDEPVLAEDLPFYEIAGDAAQSYLTPSKSPVDPEPMAGMPLLDAKNPDVLVNLDEETAAPMGTLEIF